MHEFSIVSSLLESCEEIAQENNAKKVLKVCVEIGERSGVNPKLLQSAFEEFKMGSICDNAVLSIENTKVTLRCFKCEKDFIALTLDYTHCPNCNCEDVRIVGGDAMLLKRLEME